jgi:hypothetical protein
MEPVSLLLSVQTEWQENVSKHDIHKTRQTNSRTDIQESQQSKFSKFTQNGTREFIFICSNRMARKCEQV